MGRCYYYGNESAELKAVEKKEKTPVEKESDNVIKRIIIDDDKAEFLIKTAYEL